MTAPANSSYLQLPLIRMVDLAISSPDGFVNFHLLQAILHALIQKTSSQSLAIEIHGPEAAKLQEQLKTVQEKPTFNIKETADKSTGGKDQMVYVMTPETMYQGASSIAKEQVDNLESEMNDLKRQIQELRDLPGNLGIIGAVKNADDRQTNVLDVFHMMALQKRVEAAEEGMVKVATIVEDLIKSPGGLTLEMKNVVCQKDEVEQAMGHASESSVAKGAKTSNASVHSEPNLTNRLKGKSLADQLDELAKDVIQLQQTCGDQESSVLAQVIRDLDAIKERLRMKKPGAVHSQTSQKDAEAEAMEEAVFLGGEVEFNILDAKFKELAEHVSQLDLYFNEEVVRLHSQFTDIEKDFNDLLSKLDQAGGGSTHQIAGPPAPYGPSGTVASESNACCASLYQSLIQLQTEVAHMTDTSTRLMEDKDEKNKMIDVIMEQIEVLKTVKADREDIEEALADKADACAVLRKVSHDQFDSACQELSRGIEDALEKLMQQELLWQHALEDIQCEIGNKLDKMELGPLRDFINNKLRMLQDKMKSLAALKREQEAAGSKNKLLRDVNCISCDRDVVMKRDYDLTFRPAAPTMPPTRSMAPYLAYELDALRKQQRGMPGSKNLHNFEAAMQGRLQTKADDHICNRYCGGSHTITTAQQRVTRLGHFLMQWGPEATTIEPKRASGMQQATPINLQPNVGALKSPSRENARRGSKSSKLIVSEDNRQSPEGKKRGSLVGSSAKKLSQASVGKGSKESAIDNSSTARRGSSDPAIAEDMDAIAEGVVTVSEAAEMGTEDEAVVAGQ